MASLHSQLLHDFTLADFGVMFPDRFQNKTNGVSPRRFMKLANPRLCQLITETIGCLLYTSDAADERSSVDLGGRRIIKKKKTQEQKIRSISKDKDIQMK